MSTEGKGTRSLRDDRSYSDDADGRRDVGTFRERALGQLDQIRFYIYATLLVLLLLVGFLWQRILISVAPGNHAILYDLFRGGTRTDRVYDEGLQLIWPWNKLIVYETRLQQQTISFKVLSEEGLELGVTLTIRYAPVVTNLGYLHRDIGPDYFNRLIRPDIEGHLRHSLGGRPAHEIYSSAREVLQEISRVPLLGRIVIPPEPGHEPITAPYLRLEELKLVGVELPAALSAAINEKQRQEQLSLEYKYRLQREEKEAERKRTEAAGIRDYNTIAGKISPDVLRWRSVDATESLAKSTNSKIIVLGGGQGVPLMLNFTDPPAGSPSAAAPAPNLPAPPKPAAAAPPRPAPAPSMVTPPVTAPRATNPPGDGT